MGAGILNAMGTIVRTEGARALFKGLSPALVGTAPFAALNFTTYQLLQTHLCDRGTRQASTFLSVDYVLRCLVKGNGSDFAFLAYM